MMRILVCVIIYAFMWWQTWAALFADIQSAGDPSIANRGYRHDLSLAFLMAAVPVCWLLAPFLTGFYEFGWNWKFRRMVR